MLSAGEDPKVEGSTGFPCGGFKDVADEDASEGNEVLGGVRVLLPGQAKPAASASRLCSIGSRNEVQSGARC